MVKTTKSAIVQTAGKIFYKPLKWTESARILGILVSADCNWMVKKNYDELLLFSAQWSLVPPLKILCLFYPDCYINIL